ncbi:MAG TPA: S8 family serine peptidase, partial [Longimicrobium sp.]|nr:S8 family serine peptidase [Longimicrobium sp.]
VSIHVANRLADPNNGDNVVGIFIEANAPGGEWTIRLHGEKVDDGTFHAWIERDNLSQTRFVGQAESEFTLGSLSCGRNTIVVGSYDGHEVTRPLSFFSASGPTRDGRQKPDICAPGHDVLAARSGTRSGVTSKKGTSMAAPAVAGAVALLLAEAARGNRALSSEEIRDILIGTAVPMTNGAVPWDPPSGFGRLSVGAALRRLLGEGDASGLTVLPGTPVPPIEMADPAATGPEPDEASVVDPPGA